MDRCPPSHRSPLKPAAELLAAKKDWPKLYDAAVLSSDRCPPTAALVSYEDAYVEREFSEDTAILLGEPARPKAKLWITNEFQHNGLRVEPAMIFNRLLQMVKGESTIPS